MTDHDALPTSDWPDPCPPWCVLTHEPGQHPEDRQHRSSPICFGVMAGSGPWPVRLGESDAVVYLASWRGEDEPLVRVDVGAASLTLTLAGADQLRGALEGLAALAAGRDKQ